VHGYNTKYNEAEDFEERTSDKRAPTDPIEAWRQDLEHVEILPKAQFVERAKDVEAGKTAEMLLSINEAVDADDPEALLRFREEYIERRKETMRLESAGKAAKDGEEADESADESIELEAGDPVASIDQDEEPGGAKTKHQLMQAQVAKNKEIRLERATAEADGLIKLALKQRIAVEPGKTELPEDRRRDLEAMAEQGVRARGEMVEGLLRYAFGETMQPKYLVRGARAGMAPMDVMQEANIGVIRTADKYDWRLGWSPTTYADRWVQQTVTRSFANGLVRMPVHFSEEVARAHTAEQKVRARLEEGEELTDAAVAKEAKMTVAKLNDVRAHDPKYLYLDQEHRGDRSRSDADGTALVDTFEDPRAELLENQVAETDRLRELRILLDEAFEVAATRPPGRSIDGPIDTRVPEIMRQWFGIGLDGPRTLDEIRRDMGISRERVRQLFTKGKDRILADEQLSKRIQALL
jgi:RNA polymerase primary sigma factor